jgi:hypothetical protein
MGGLLIEFGIYLTFGFWASFELCLPAGRQEL